MKRHVVVKGTYLSHGWRRETVRNNGSELAVHFYAFRHVSYRYKRWQYRNTLTRLSYLYSCLIDRYCNSHQT
jgi:hypothetical protein